MTTVFNPTDLSTQTRMWMTFEGRPCASFCLPANPGDNACCHTDRLFPWASLFEWKLAVTFGKTRRDKEHCDRLFAR